MSYINRKFPMRGFCLFLMLLLLGCGPRDNKIERNALEEIKVVSCDTIPLYEENREKEITAVSCEYLESIEPTVKLRDRNTVHLLFAQHIGLDYGYKRDKAFLRAKDSLVKNGLLVPIRDGQYYRVKEMEHSFPYLTPEAASLLEEIGMRFRDNLEAKRRKPHAIFITSALRTDESQRRLFRRNKNATRSTTSHLYGTTFDISYLEFYRCEDGVVSQQRYLQDVLTKTMREMRAEKCCLVMREVKQRCFHVTVIQ